MSKIRILDAVFKCAKCGQKIKLAHMKCVKEKQRERIKEFLDDINEWTAQNHSLYWISMREKWEKEII